MVRLALIGSRNSPPVILDLMTELAKVFAQRGYHGYSGGNTGADTAWAEGYSKSQRWDLFTQILPWSGYKNREGVGIDSYPHDVRELALQWVLKVNPDVRRLRPEDEKFHIRSFFQVCPDGDPGNPVDALYCWTPWPEIGDILTPLRLARRLGVKKVVNLSDPTLDQNGLTVSARAAAFVGTRKDPPVMGFFGEHRFLSNFWYTPVVHEGRKFTSVEAAFQSAKTKHANYDMFRDADPRTAKSLGKHLGLREDWEKMKVEVMRSCLESKFSNPRMKQMLASTGSAYLEETNTWGDTFWGVCYGQGENRLGKLLMEIRDRGNQ